MDIKLTCPLGHECERAEGQTIHRCRWYTEMRGKDATGQDHDSWRCAIAWMPILQVEMAGTNRGQTAAIESLRNEQTKRQDAALHMAAEKLKSIK